MHELNFADFRHLLGSMREKRSWDFVVCSGNCLLGTAGDPGKNLGGLFESGIDVILTGEKALARPTSRKLLGNVPATDGQYPKCAMDGALTEGVSAADGQYPQSSRDGTFLESATETLEPGKRAMVRPLNVPFGAPGVGAKLLKHSNGCFWLVCLDSGSDRRPLEDPIRSFERWYEDHGEKAPVLVNFQGGNIPLKKALAWRFSRTEPFVHCIGTGTGAATVELLCSEGRAFVADAGVVEVEGAIQGQSPERWWQIHEERHGIGSLPPSGYLRGDAVGMVFGDRFEIRHLERYEYKARKPSIQRDEKMTGELNIG